MEIQITRGKKNGHGFKTIFVDGREESSVRASRAITKTINEDGAGIFNQMAMTKFYFGDETKTFEFNELDFTSDSSKKIREELKRRIETVRAWVDSIDYEETFKFNV